MTRNAQRSNGFLVKATENNKTYLASAFFGSDLGFAPFMMIPAYIRSDQRKWIETRKKSSKIDRNEQNLRVGELVTRVRVRFGVRVSTRSEHERERTSDKWDGLEVRGFEKPKAGDIKLEGLNWNSIAHEMKFGGLGGILNFMTRHRSLCFRTVGCVDLKLTVLRSSIFSVLCFPLCFFSLGRSATHPLAVGFGSEQAHFERITCWDGFCLPKLNWPKLLLTLARIRLGPL